MARLKTDDPKRKAVSDYIEGGDFLVVGEFTDADTSMIQNLSAEITEGLCIESERVQALFYWVRDNIRYAVGLNRDKASTTVLKGFGSCLNKSNVLVSLLRARNIPAAFSVMRVKTREYFGPLGFERFRPLVSEESNHCYVQVYLNDGWIKLDCTDDFALCASTGHLERQGQAVDFDGVSDACLNLDPEHIVKDDGRLLVDVDHVFRKKPGVPPFIVDIFNICMSYVRHNGKYYSTVGEIEASFFDYFATHHPDKYRLFRIIEDTNMSKTMKKVILFTHQLKQRRAV